MYHFHLQIFSPYLILHGLSCNGGSFANIALNEMVLATTIPDVGKHTQTP
jgi:hypothetical protein